MTFGVRDFVAVLNVGSREAVHDLVLCILAATEEINFVTYQYHQMLLQGALFCLQIYRAFVLLACVNNLIGISRTESFNYTIWALRHLRGIILLSIRVICAFDRRRGIKRG